MLSLLQRQRGLTCGKERLVAVGLANSDSVCARSLSFCVRHLQQTRPRVQHFTSIATHATDEAAAFSSGRGAADRLIGGTPIPLVNFTERSAKRSLCTASARRGGKKGFASTATGTESEGDADDLPWELRTPQTKINTRNLSLHALVKEVKDGVLNLKPAYQRDFVWDKARCMGLLRTVVTGLPMPSVMLHTRTDGRGGQPIHEVVDGKQRLVTLYVYISGDNSAFPEAPTVMELEPDDDLSPHLHNKTFKQLPARIQKRLEYYDLICNMIPKETQLDVVFRIYEGVNAGGVEHSAQQLRRAVFYGHYVQLLSDLSRADSEPGGQLALLADFSADDLKLQQPEELVLRFFALRNMINSPGKRSFPRAVKEILNLELLQVGRDNRKTTRELSEDEEGEMRKTFTDTLKLVCSLALKEAACRALQLDSAAGGGGKTKTFRRLGTTTGAGPLWDTTLLGLSRALDWYSPHQFERNADRLVARYEALLRSREWAAVPSVFSRKNLATRLELFDREVVQPAMAGERKLEPCTADASDEDAPAPAPVASSPRRRTFTSDERQALWDSSPRPACAWCGKRIMSIAHAHVDHVTPYSRGGRTSLDNAQLLHRVCNLEKGKKGMAEAPAAAAAAVVAAAAMATAAAVEGAGQQQQQQPPGGAAAAMLSAAVAAVAASGAGNGPVVAMAASGMRKGAVAAAARASGRC